MNRFEKSKTVYNKLFGDLPDNSKENDPEFMNILRKFIFGDVFSSKDEIDMQTRELVTITILATIQTLPQLKVHLSSCLNIDIDPLEIREAIYQLAPFIGFPKTLNAIQVMNEVFKEKGLKLPLKNTSTVTDENRFELGSAIQYPLYGDEIKDRYPDIAELPTFLTEFCFGDFYTREGLSIKKRELLILVALTSLNADKQIKAHLLGNLKVGNTKEEIIAVMLQCIPYLGFPSVINAINILNTL